MNSDGTLAHGSGVTLSGHAVSGVAGYYFVRFNRDISACAMLATVGGTTGTNIVNNVPTGEASVSPGIPTDVLVRTQANGGTATDEPFHLAVFC